MKRQLFFTIRLLRFSIVSGNIFPYFYHNLEPLCLGLLSYKKSDLIIWLRWEQVPTSRRWSEYLSLEEQVITKRRMGLSSWLLKDHLPTMRFKSFGQIISNYNLICQYQETGLGICKTQKFINYWHRDYHFGQDWIWHTKTFRLQE